MPTTYRYTALNDPSAANRGFPAAGTTANGINAAGQIVGSYQDVSGTTHGFLYSGGTYTTLDAPAATATVPSAINGLGQIVGTYTDASGTHNFLYSGGSYTVLADLPGRPTGINDFGQIVGSYVTRSVTGFNTVSVSHGYAYSGGSYTTLDDPAAGAVTSFNTAGTLAVGINNSGQIVGNYVGGPGLLATHGFVYSGGTYTTIDDPLASGRLINSSSYGTFPSGINALGEIVGDYSEISGGHGFVYAGSTYITIDDPLAQANSTGASGINDLGEIVGTYGDATGVHGFLATPGRDFDNARLGDFDANGRADILFQSVNPAADAAIWQTNSSGTLSSATSIGPVPSGYRIDGTGNFNSTPGDDILLRSPTSLAVLPMNGTTPQPMQVLGGTSPQWLNSGIGDFTGDGQSDLLFRNVSTGEIATWGVANNALSTAPKVLGSTAPQYHIVAVDDFTGDHQADILFRNDNGSLAIWQVANNALVGAPGTVGSAPTAYHVVGTGDFDGNGSNDILFRSDNGDLAMWLLNSSGALLGAPAAIGTAGARFDVEGIGDLNGDGRADIIFHDANGSLVEWLMKGTSFAAPPSVIGSAAQEYTVAAHHFDLV
jgi:probable HAF family extracellular repeat protein